MPIRLYSRNFPARSPGFVFFPPWQLKGYLPFKTSIYVNVEAMYGLQNAVAGLKESKLDPDFDLARIEAMKQALPDPHILEEFEVD